MARNYDNRKENEGGETVSDYMMLVWGRKGGRSEMTGRVERGG